MTVTATDYNPGSANGVVVTEDVTTTQNFTLTGVGILEGTVRASTNAPLAGARVEVVGPVTRNTTTDTNGLYRLRLPVGTYAMTVTIYAYEPGTATVDVVDGLTTTQDFTLVLAPAHSVSGTVSSSTTGLPIANATVRVLNTPIAPATTDADGMYVIPSVPDGNYNLQASARAFSPRTTPIVVDQDLIVDFALDPMAGPCNPSNRPPSECTTVAGNLVANCGWETGLYPPWVRSGNLGATGIDAQSAHSGSFGLDIGPVGSLGFVAQDLATKAGGTYSLSFWLKNLGGNPNRIQISWGGAVILDQTNLPSFPYTEYCWEGSAAGESTELKFGMQQDPTYFHFDDVVVVPR
jgi:hypothetical protein